MENCKEGRLTGRVGSFWDSAASLLMGSGSFWRWRWPAHVSQCYSLIRNKHEMVERMMSQQTCSSLASLFAMVR